MWGQASMVGDRREGTPTCRFHSLPFDKKVEPLLPFAERPVIRLQFHNPKEV